MRQVISLLILLVVTNSVFAVNFSGRYELQAQGLIFTISLSEQGSMVRGTLTGANGVVIQMQGTKMNHMISGRSSANGMMGLFQGVLHGQQLSLTMMDAFPNGAPNYATARQLVFQKIVSKPTKAATKSPKKSLLSKKVKTEKIVNQLWDFTARPPAGWIVRMQQDRAILGHNKIAGMILLSPHQHQSKSTMRHEMKGGLNEDGFSLYLKGKLYDFRTNGLFGDYSGFANNQTVKAQTFGILLESGKGAYIVAMAAPNVFSTQLIEAAAALAKTLEVDKRKNVGGGLAQHFVGTWKTYTKYSERTVTLYANGTYYDSYTASYGGGEAPGAIARDDQGQGRWSVRGTKEQGVMSFSDNTGTSQVQYRVHVKDGHTYYSEYFFDGALFGKE